MDGSVSIYIGNYYEKVFEPIDEFDPVDPPGSVSEMNYISSFPVVGNGESAPFETIPGQSYYYVGANRVATRTEEGEYIWIYGDHLGSTSVTADRDGNELSRRKYTAWGVTRSGTGAQATDYGYTGQMQVDDIYYYNARWYDPAIGRFMQADTIVPPHQGTQGFDRYAYVNNNPMRYTDPSGHFSKEEIYAYLVTYYDGDEQEASYTLEKWQNNKVWWAMMTDAQAGDELYVDSYATFSGLGIIEPGKEIIMDEDKFIHGQGLQGLEKYDLVKLETGSVIDGYSTVTILPNTLPSTMFGLSASGSISGVESGSLSVEYYYHPYNPEPKLSISSSIDIGLGTGTSGNATVYFGVLSPWGYSNTSSTFSFSASAGLLGVTFGLWFDDSGKTVGWFAGWAPGLGISASYSAVSNTIWEQ